MCQHANAGGLKPYKKGMKKGRTGRSGLFMKK